MKNRAEYYRYHDGDGYRNLEIGEVFSRIHDQQRWNVLSGQDSVSGPGSSLEQTRHVLKALPPLLAKYGVDSVLDIPCGDFNWMRHLDWSGINYTGADIVERLVRDNLERYRSANITFKILDVTADPLPQVHLVFCRDCLVHLSHRHIFDALRNIRRSGSRYLMTTTFAAEESNEDVDTGGWRPINLTKPPFNLAEPLELINEHCSEADGLFNDKSLGLWAVNEISEP